MPDLCGDHRGVAGSGSTRSTNRIAALGWPDIPVRVVDVADLISAERDENQVRKDFTPSEAVAIARVIDEALKERTAARCLGLTQIEASVLSGDESHLEIELIEIDENLCRAELTPAQRAAAIKRRKQIWEALHPGGTNCSTSLADGRKAGPQHEQQFACETAAISGQSKQDINRHLARADALGPDLLAVAGTSLDKGVELDALKAIPALGHFFDLT